jgi:hypothetical protein
VLVVVIACAPAAVAQSPSETFAVRQVHIETRDVFSEEEADRNFLYALGNTLHATTRSHVVEREMWFGAGDRVTRAEVEELARNLRSMRLFGAADVELIDEGNGEADLSVRTRDRLSLLVGAGVAVVGGVTEFSGSLGEVNLFGLGKRLSVSFKESDEEQSATLAYDDPQLFGTWHQLALRLGDTDEGFETRLTVVRPFKHLADPASWGGSIDAADEGVDYYQRGETVAEVPIERRALSGFAASGAGPRDLRRTLGVDVRAASFDYEPATGSGASLVHIPGDTDELELGLAATIDWAASYPKRTRIDTIDYVQDFELGASGRVRAAGQARDEDGVGTEVHPVLELGGRAAAEALADTFVTAEAGGRVRWHAGEVHGYRASGALHTFQASLPAQTLAASIAFDAVFDIDNLTPQLTLGEDNGLRGYPAREFTGTRIVRLNLEDRIFTGVEILKFELGLVAFFDAGWVHGTAQGLSISDAITSAGCGLRIGSTNWLGRNVLRIDVGFPLTMVGGEDYDPSVSLSVGQVFDFFGNAAELQYENF